MNTTDTVKAKLTPGEFVIRKEAVDMIGVPMLEKLNGMPEEGGGHSAIDRIIQMATLQNMQPMYSGGEVEPNFSGDMQGMMGGGYMKPQQYEDGGQAMSNLKPVPDNNPGLAKLPEDVRNKMGYMQEGGVAYIDPADSSIVIKSPEQSKMFNEFTTNTNFAPGTSKKYMLETIIDALNNPEYYGLNKKDTLKDNNMIPKSIKAPDSTIDSLIGMMQGGEVPGYQDGGQPQQDDAQVQAMMEQQAMMQQQPQPNQFVPFDQRPNQNPATGNWGESGDYMQAIRAEKDSLDMQDKEILRQKALNAIQHIRLDSLAGQGIPSDVVAINSDAMGSYSRPDSARMSIDRNKGQYFQQQVMQRSPYDSTTRSNSYKEGLESVLQGMFQGDNNRGIYR